MLSILILSFKFGISEIRTDLTLRITANRKDVGEHSPRVFVTLPASLPRSRLVIATPGRTLKPRENAEKGLAVVGCPPLEQG